MCLGANPSYHLGQTLPRTGQAHGLSFSVPDGIASPSLVNIFKELHTDVGKPYPQSGDLSAWADQGVLLLNATLTVTAHQAGSHQGKGWEQFTDTVIQNYHATVWPGLYFIGGYAKKKGSLIDAEKHLVTSGHPSPLSANRSYWFGHRHFSQCNNYLLKQGARPITW